MNDYYETLLRLCPRIDDGSYCVHTYGRRVYKNYTVHYLDQVNFPSETDIWSYDPVNQYSTLHFRKFSSIEEALSWIDGNEQ